MCADKKTPDSEGELIDLFKSLFEPEIPPSDLLIGIGDDAAAFEPGVDPETKFVVTTDMLVEDVHFLKIYHSPYDIGWRTATANLSDIAAMGAHPRWGVATIAAPAGMSTDEIMEFARGLKEALAEHEAFLIGGDLTRSTDKISVSMTLIGETTGRLLTRSGAQLGDVIAVTGSLGASGAGLAALLADDIQIPDDVKNSVIERHLRPRARIWAGQVLANNPGIHAMMDISDGLGIDLSRICSASETGSRIFEENFPVYKGVYEIANALERDRLEFVTAGEDFELLVTGDREAVEIVMGILAEEPDQPSLTIIGDIIDAPFGLHLARTDGSVLNPSQLGWDHFHKGD